jgi:hypothetical protein
VPLSVDAAQALGSHLAGLNTYLTEHHTPVESLTLASPEHGWSGPGQETGGGQGTHQGAGHQASQQPGQSPRTETQSSESSGPEILPTASSAGARRMEGPMESGRPGSVHISVMA